jgi:hypothetical protein
MIPEPEGFELREKRAERSGSARDVTPLDALFDAYERVKSNPKVQCLFVCWYELSENGLPVLKWSSASDWSRGTAALLADAVFETQLAARSE